MVFLVAIIRLIAHYQSGMQTFAFVCRRFCVVAPRRTVGKIGIQKSFRSTAFERNV